MALRAVCLPAEEGKSRCPLIWESRGILEWLHNSVFPACTIEPVKRTEVEELAGIGKPLYRGREEAGTPATLSVFGFPISEE